MARRFGRFVVAGLATVGCGSDTQVDTARPVLAFSGDSLTLGIGSEPGDDWPSQLEDQLTERSDVIFDPVGGQMLAGMIDQDAARFDAKRPPDGAGYLFGWAGTNDLYAGADADATIAQYRAWSTARRAAGWHVIVFTVLPRSNDETPATFEQQRQSMNAQIRETWPEFADALVDIAADPRIGDPGDELDPTFYADRLHLTAAGYAIVAEQALDVVAEFDIR